MLHFPVARLTQHVKRPVEVTIWRYRESPRDMRANARHPSDLR